MISARPAPAQKPEVSPADGFSFVCAAVSAAPAAATKQQEQDPLEDLLQKAQQLGVLQD